jgi:hypothetical protein
MHKNKSNQICSRLPLFWLVSSTFYPSSEVQWFVLVSLRRELWKDNCIPLTLIVYLKLLLKFIYLFVMFISFLCEGLLNSIWNLKPNKFNMCINFRTNRSNFFLTQLFFKFIFFRFQNYIFAYTNREVRIKFITKKE